MIQEQKKSRIQITPTKTVRIWARHRTQFTIGQSLVTISRVRGRGNQFLVKVKTTEETEVRRENTVDNSR